MVFGHDSHGLKRVTGRICLLSRRSNKMSSAAIVSITLSGSDRNTRFASTGAINSMPYGAEISRASRVARRLACPVTSCCSYGPAFSSRCSARYACPGRHSPKRR